MESAVTERMAGRAGSKENWERRFAEIEAELARLEAEVRELRADWHYDQEAGDLQAQYAALREAVLRYAVACGAVEVQIAMMRARGAGGDVADNLQRSIEEQNAASDALRSLARTLNSTPDTTK
jgi:chromosome segregation ATPase